MPNQAAPASKADQTSYVDSYDPSATGSGDNPVVAPDPVVVSDPVVSPDPIVVPSPVVDPVVTPDPVVAPKPIVDPIVAPDPVVEPTPTPTPTPTREGKAPTPPTTPTEKLEDQNIFFLLGVKEDQATNEQRESFLDELQQVIWEDFLENDVQLLLTRDEMKQMRVLMEKSKGKQLEEQEEIVVFLEKLIPDLEEIMLEKALELKADMFKERIAGTREYHVGKTEQLSTVDKAEEQMKVNQWLTAARTLNSLE